MYGARTEKARAGTDSRRPLSTGSEQLKGVPKAAERAKASVRSSDLVRISADEQRAHDEKAQIFSLIVMADCLDRAWLNRSISDTDYEQHCQDLIQRFNLASNAYKASVPDIAEFCRLYRIDAQNGYYHGYNRLCLSRSPATVEYALPRARDRREQQMHVSTCTEKFISLLDSLAMNILTVEDLLPIAQDLSRAIGRVECVETGYGFKEQLQSWVHKLNRMGATGCLTEDEKKDFKLRVEMGFDDFKDRLTSGA